MSIQPTRAAVRALDDAHGVNSAATVRDGAVRTAIASEFGDAETAAAELNISVTAMERYLDEEATPFKGDVMAIEMMWASWQELNP